MLDSRCARQRRPATSACGYRGLIANTAGKTIEIPIRANYREVLIYSNTSFRRVVRVKVLPIPHFVLRTQVTSPDVLSMSRRMLSSARRTAAAARGLGCLRYLRRKAPHSQPHRASYRPLSAQRLCRRGYRRAHRERDKMMSEDDAKRVADKVYESTTTRKERSPRSGERARGQPCKDKDSFAAYLPVRARRLHQCYGANLATGEPVTVGEAVGIIIAAQSIGEPGTQPDDRNVPTPAARRPVDITEGLPRVEGTVRSEKAQEPRSYQVNRYGFRARDQEGSETSSSPIPRPSREKAYPSTTVCASRLSPAIPSTKATPSPKAALNPHDILAVSASGLFTLPHPRGSENPTVCRVLTSTISTSGSSSVR